MMKTKGKIMSMCSLTKIFRGKETIRFAVGISLALALAGPAFAQYGGGGAGMGGGPGTGTTGTATPSYGTSGKAIGIRVGAARGGAAVLYLAQPHAGTVPPCGQSGGGWLSIV